MKTKAQVIRDNSQFKSLINAVIKQLGGTNYVQDVNNNGADAGYLGFTYYSDTHSFAIKNRVQIAALLEETAQQFGEDTVTMVCNFGVFRRNPADNEDKKDIYKFLSGGKPEQGTITNVLAWFALEEVCRMFDN